MIAMLLSVGSDRYALPAADILEVLPLVALKRVPPAPPCLAGLLNYHGVAVPVIDLCALMTASPCKPSLSSRIVLAKYLVSAGRTEPLGLMIERGTELATIDPEALIPADVSIPEAPYLGKLVLNGAELVQLVETRQLLNDAARNLLFADNDHVPPPARSDAA